METYCEYSQYVKKGLDQYLICSKSCSYCKYQRLCPTRRIVVHTDKYEDCPILKKGEDKMATTTKKKAVEKKEKVEKLVETNTAKGMVIIANPNYYIVQTNGCNFKVIKKNNYKVGDVI